MILIHHKVTTLHFPILIPSILNYNCTNPLFKTIITADSYSHIQLFFLFMFSLMAYSVGVSTKVV